MAATYASPAGRCTELISDHAISEPRAPTAPYARLSTPVARYSTTSPTPDRANTPPRARPRTRNGLRSGTSLRLLYVSQRGVAATKRMRRSCLRRMWLFEDHSSEKGQERRAQVYRQASRPNFWGAVWI